MAKINYYVELNLDRGIKRRRLAGRAEKETQRASEESERGT